jgi:hypothetical protein
MQPAQEARLGRDFAVGCRAPRNARENSTPALSNSGVAIRRRVIDLNESLVAAAASSALAALNGTVMRTAIINPTILHGKINGLREVASPILADWSRLAGRMAPCPGRWPNASTTRIETGADHINEGAR